MPNATRVCNYCFGPMPEPKRFGRPRRFCTKACTIDFHAERAKEEAAAQRERFAVAQADLDRMAAAVPPRQHYGPRALLHPVEIAEVVRRARLVMDRNPSGFGGARIIGGDRGRLLRGLAAEYGINVRTLYRYLTISTVEEVRIGNRVAWFGLRWKQSGEEVVQLTTWIPAPADDEAIAS